MRNKPIETSKFRHLYPFQSHYFNIDGLKYHYVDEGSGMPVIMVHGNPTWSFYYRDLIKTLSPEYRAIAVDHIGCGLSDKPRSVDYDYVLARRVDDLNKLINHLDINQKVILVLHDWGGMIGIIWALANLDRIAGIVILNTAAFFPPDGQPLPLRLRVLISCQPFARIAIQGFNAFALSAVYMATSKGLAKDVRQGMLAPYNSWDNRIATLKFVEDIPLDPSHPSYREVESAQDNLHRIDKIPVLICWGMKDFVFTPAYLQEWRRRFPDAQVYQYKNAGHYVLEDAKEEVIQNINDFLLTIP